MEKKIAVEADYGDELVIQVGARSLRVVVDSETLLPDFAEAIIRVIGYDPLLALRVAESAYHHTIGSKQHAETVFAGLRDKFFDDVKRAANASKPAEEEPTPDAEEDEPSEAPKTSRKKSSKRG